MNFLVITGAPTFIERGEYISYAPYVNEMNIWFENVSVVGIISPSAYPEVVFAKPFDRQDIKFFKLPFIRLSNPYQAFRFLIFLPWVKIKIINSFIWADHIHLRCPGNIGLIACFIQIFFPKKPKSVKYAGNWDSDSKQPLSYKIQKWILSNTFLSRNVKVLVYGEWPNQSKNILPFFTSSFSETDKGIVTKNFNYPFKFIFVGSLSAGKNPLYAIKLIEGLRSKGISVQLDFYGDGLLKTELHEYIISKKIDHFVRLMGNRKLEELKEVYKASHFLILASQSEGWPKVVAEAMFFGCIPITTAVSCVPWMLGSGSFGILLPRLDRFSKGQFWVNESEVKVIELLKEPNEMKRKSLAAQEWSQEYTLEKFEAAVKEVLRPSHHES